METESLQTSLCGFVHPKFANMTSPYCANKRNSSNLPKFKEMMINSVSKQNEQSSGNEKYNNLSDVHQYPRTMKPKTIVRKRFTNAKNLINEPWVSHPYLKGAEIKRYGKVWHSLYNQIQKASVSRKPSPVWMGNFYKNSFDETKVKYCSCSQKNNQSSDLYEKRLNTVMKEFQSLDLDKYSSEFPPTGKREVMV